MSSVTPVASRKRRQGVRIDRSIDRSIVAVVARGKGRRGDPLSWGPRADFETTALKDRDYMDLLSPVLHTSD